MESNFISSSWEEICEKKKRNLDATWREQKIYRASDNRVKGRVSSSHIRHTVGILKSRRLQRSLFFRKCFFFHYVRILFYTTARRIHFVPSIATNRNDDKTTMKLWRSFLRRAVRIIARNIDFRQSMGRVRVLLRLVHNAFTGAEETRVECSRERGGRSEKAGKRERNEKKEDQVEDSRQPGLTSGCSGSDWTGFAWIP